MSPAARRLQDVQGYAPAIRSAIEAMPGAGVPSAVAILDSRDSVAASIHAMIENAPPLVEAAVVVLPAAALGDMLAARQPDVSRMLANALPLPLAAVVLVAHGGVLAFDGAALDTERAAEWLAANTPPAPAALN